MNAPESAAGALIREGSSLLDAGRAEDAIGCYDRVVERFGEAREQDRAVFGLVVRALMGKGAALGDLDRPEATDAVAAELAQRLGPANQVPALERACARITEEYIRVLTRRGQHELAIAVVDDWLERLAGDAASPPALVVGAMRMKAFALSKAGHTDEAILLLGELVDRHAELDDIFVQTGVARAMLELARLLDESGAPPRALTAYQNVVSRFSVSERPALNAVVAEAQTAMATNLEADGSREQALRVLDDLFARVQRHPNAVRSSAARNAFLRKTKLLQDLGRGQDALACCDEVHQRFREDDHDDWRRSLVGAALSAKAEVLLDMDEPEQAVRAVDELLEEAGEDVAPEMRRTVAIALANKQVALTRLGRAEDAHATDAEFLRRFGEASEPKIRTQALGALSRKAFALEQAGKVDQALEAFDEILDRYGEATDPDMRRRVNNTLTHEAELASLNGDLRRVITLSEQMIARVQDESDPKQQALMARGLASKAGAIVNGGHYQRGIDLIDELHDHFGASTEPDVRAQLALSLMNKALALDRLGKQDEMESVQDDMVARFGEQALSITEAHAGHCAAVQTAAARDQLAGMLYAKAWLLASLGRPEDALAPLDELEQQFAHDESPVIQQSFRLVQILREGLIEADDK